MMNGTSRNAVAIPERVAVISPPKLYNKPKYSASEVFSLVSQDSSTDMGGWLESGTAVRMISDILSTDSTADNDDHSATSSDARGSSGSASDQASTTTQDPLSPLRDALIELCERHSHDVFSFGVQLGNLLHDWSFSPTDFNVQRALLALAEQCTAPLAPTTPSPAQLQRRLLALTPREHTQPNHCPSSKSRARVAMQHVLPSQPISAAAVKSSCAPHPFQAVSDARSTLLRSENEHVARHATLSPLTSPGTRTPSPTDGVSSTTAIPTHAQVLTRSASVSHIHTSAPSLFAEFTNEPKAPASLERAHTSASVVEVAPHPHDAICVVEHAADIDETRDVTNELVAEPQSCSTAVTSQPLDTSAPEYATSSMSSASFRRKSSKLRDVLAPQQSVVQPMHDAPLDQLAQTPAVLAAPSAEPQLAIDHERQLEKDALGIIGASIADGDYAPVLSTLKAHRKSHAVAVVACTFLESVCRDKNLYFDFCEEGGIEELMSAALLFGKLDNALCIVVLNAISALSVHRDDRVSHRLRGTGVPSVVIDMLTHYRTDTVIQTAGCECLALMAHSSKQSQTAIATLGGPGIVYRAITQNNSSFRDVKLARAALKAVRYIAEDNERAAEYLVEVAALDPVTSVAELFTDDGLEQDVLHALEAFSFYSNGRRSIIMSSGMKALATIMLRNREPRFLVQCCNFIRAIARWNDSECETSVLQSGISERVVSLMEMSNTIVGVEGARLSWYACYACTFLASFGKRSRQRLRRVGAVESILDVFRRRMEDAKVVHIATDALAELMKNEPETRKLAMDRNIVGCLKEALILHRGSSRVAKALQWTLEFLAAPDGAVFTPAYSSQIHQETMRESSSTTHSTRDPHKSQSWKSAFGFIRAPRKKSRDHE